MVNPVKQNAGQIPLNTQNFFEGDGKTVSAPWRAFLRNVSDAIGIPGGGSDSSGLIAQVKEQGASIESLFALESSTASAIAIGALLARIGFLEQSVPAVIPTAPRPSNSSISEVALPRLLLPSSDPLLPIATRPASEAVPMVHGSTRPVAESIPLVFAPPAQYALIGASVSFSLLSVTDTTNKTAQATLTNTGSNGANLRLLGNGSTTPSKTIRANAGALQILNDAYSVAILTLTDAGNLTIPGTFSFTPATTTTAPAAGGAGALPATPTGYFTTNLDGVARKVAYY